MPVNGREQPAEPSEDENDWEAIRKEIAGLRREVERLRPEVQEPEVPNFLTVQQVADRLALSERTIRSYIASEELPSVPFGRARRVPVDGLRDFIQDHLG